MDIGSKHGYPSSSLSNFSPHPFTVTWRGFTVQSNSMEGFLQGLKFKNPDMQKYVSTLVGYAAKKKGKEKNWRVSQALWWNGQSIDRHSDEYQELLDIAFDALSKNSTLRAALLSTGDAILTHNIGKTNANETVLTQKEFCSRLMKIRNSLK